MHRDTEKFLSFLLVKENERNKVLARKIRYGKPSKLLDKEEAKYDKYEQALEKIRIVSKGKNRWHPLTKKRYDPTKLNTNSR